MRNQLVALAAVFVVLAAGSTRAQVTSTQPQTGGGSQGWTFNVTPYAWLPTLRSNLNYTTPGGNTLSQNISAGIGDYISDINFAAMVGGEARYGRFSVLTDVVYTNLSLTSSNTHLGAVNLGPGPIFIPRETTLITGTRAQMTIWNLAGGYTVLQGEWGNLDVLAGLRLLGISSRLNYTLASDITLPNQTLVLSRTGSPGLSTGFWNAIGGIRGRINIPNSRFYVPFYFDAGGGGLKLTWQAYAGIGYQTSFADLSLGYRYLAFEGNGNRAVKDLSLGGVILAASFHF
jgi:hypothetical protein